MSNTYFDKLPGDVLQHVLNTFLNPLERAVLNESVLQSFPGERVYKKFPAEYATKHHMLIVKGIYNRINKSINSIINLASDNWPAYIERFYLKKLTILYEKLFRLLRSPINRCIYKYDNYARESILDSVMAYLEMTDPIDGHPMYINLEKYLEKNRGNPIREWVQEVITIIDTTPFEYQLLETSQRVYDTVY
jgi:hypothetical protein